MQTHPFPEYTTQPPPGVQDTCIPGGHNPRIPGAMLKDGILSGLMPDWCTTVILKSNSARENTITPFYAFCRNQRRLSVSTQAWVSGFIHHPTSFGLLCHLGLTKLSSLTPGKKRLGKPETYGVESFDHLATFTLLDEKSCT